MQNTFRVAVQLLDAPHTRTISAALKISQADWLKFRESQCFLEGTAQAFGKSASDERYVRFCRAREAEDRTKYIQNLVP